jgi:hypothetical protein
MDDAKFNRIATEGRQQLTALLSPLVGARGGRAVAYNAYFNGTEVVVLGYQYEQAGQSLTKPVAILVDDELFDHLEVDNEAGRVDGRGQDAPARTRTNGR